MEVNEVRHELNGYTVVKVNDPESPRIEYHVYGPRNAEYSLLRGIKGNLVLVNRKASTKRFPKIQGSMWFTDRGGVIRPLA